VTWPSDEQAGNANSGVAQIVSSTEGAIGYVDFSDAKAAGLSFADVKNAAGKFVTPSTAGASAAIAGATVNADMTYDPINPPGDSAYPVTSPTYIMVYAKQTDAAKGKALKAFLAYILSKDGQALAKNVDFAQLSADLDTKAVAQLDKITIG
jgi:phosphate transport system substrate-binding protein